MGCVLYIHALLAVNVGKSKLRLGDSFDFRKVLLDKGCILDVYLHVKVRVAVRKVTGYNFGIVLIGKCNYGA